MKGITDVYACPLAKYSKKEEKFYYNKPYMQYIFNCGEEEKLKRFVYTLERTVNKKKIMLAVTIVNGQNFLVISYINEERKELSFAFFLLEKEDFASVNVSKQNIANTDDLIKDLYIVDYDNIMEDIFDKMGSMCDLLENTNCCNLINTDVNGVENHSTYFIQGSSFAMKNIADIIKRVSPFDATILLNGESGVGKNRFAYMAHTLSSRKSNPYIVINCGAIPDHLMESELFGYERGAFTGANQKGKAGLIEMANHGTLFLDEIGDLPLHMQVKLLKVIQEKKITRVGGISERNIDFRLIAATNKNLSHLVETGEFRKDLFYRINVISVDIPPIRDRKEDIPYFSERLLNKFNLKYDRTLMFSNEVLEIFEKYSWPGNIRELENVIEGVVLTADKTIITKEMLPLNVSAESTYAKYDGEGKTLKQILEGVEKKIILEAYEKFRTTTKTGESLGISQASVSVKLKKYKKEKTGV